MWRSAAALVLLACLPAPVKALDIEWDGYVELEMRHFPNAGPSATHEQDFTALAGEMELGLYDRTGRHALIVTPFGRYDGHDHERSHFDLREAKYRYVNKSFELTIGVDKEFWGVTEFLHLVDIINQTDNVEGTDGEAKLGQPMVKASYASPYGTLSAYALPSFRIRQFAAPKTGRPNFGFTVDDNTTHFESGDGRQTDDFALRYKHSVGAFDIGLSYFDGTAREPQLLATPEVSSSSGLPRMVAYYAFFEQSGLDVQATLGPWLLKLEAAQSTENRKLANPLAGNRPTLDMPSEKVTVERATGGIEYSFYNLFDSGTDLGIVAEFMYDEREQDAPHPFGKDVGIGLRWTPNDVQSTAILLGTIIDMDTDSSLISLEAERRIGSNFKASLEARFQDKVGEEDPLAAANRDEDHWRFRLAYYF